MGHKDSNQKFDDLQYDKARDRVLRFMKDYGVPLIQFEQLRKKPGVFEKLTRRRFLETSGKRERSYDAYQRVILVAEMAAKSPGELLHDLGMKYQDNDPRIRAADATASTPALAGRLALVVNGNPQHNSAAAIKYAGLGFSKAAFEFLLAEFMVQSSQLDQAMHLVPALIYVGYRYVSPDTFVHGIKSKVLPFVQSSKPRGLCHATLRALSVAQIACALNEGGDGQRAGELFQRPDVREIMNTESPLEMPWPRQQLLRNAAVYWATHGADHHKALHLATQAADLKKGDLANERAVATVQCTAHIRAGNFEAAWKAIQEHYWLSLKELQTVAKEGPGRCGDLLHHFSSLVNGADARHLAREKVSDADLDAECQAIQHCLDSFGEKIGPLRLNQPHRRDVSSRLTQVMSKCLRTPLQSWQTSMLSSLAEELM